MAKLEDLGKAVIIFFLGFGLSYMLDSILPSMISGVTEFYSSTALEEVIYFGQIAITILTMIIAPIYYTIQGLTTQTEEEPMKTAIKGAIIFIFGIIIVAKAWFMIEAIGAITSTAIILACYWIGIIILFANILVLTPITVMIKARQ